MYLIVIKYAILDIVDGSVSRTSQMKGKLLGVQLRVRISAYMDLGIRSTKISDHNDYAV